MKKINKFIKELSGVLLTIGLVATVFLGYLLFIALLAFAVTAPLILIVYLIIKALT